METTMKTVFAIRQEDALSWHDTTQKVAGIAERAGWRIRPAQYGRWQVWATDQEFADIAAQAVS
jgi:hypothetical protein